MFGIIIFLYSWLRIGELPALEWSDIDFSNAIIRVMRSCHYAKSKDGQFAGITESPKTEASKRLIPIPKQLMPALKEKKRSCISKHVIADKKGECVSVCINAVLNLCVEDLLYKEKDFTLCVILLQRGLWNTERIKVFNFFV